MTQKWAENSGFPEFLTFVAQKTVADGAPEMPLPEYVEWRGNRLQYRRAFPKDVWPIVGKGRAFAKSLRTDSPSEAMRACPEAARAYFVAVDEARARLAQLANLPPLTAQAAEGLAVKWFLEALETGEAFRLPMFPDALDDALEFSSDRAADARQALAEGDLKDWKLRAAELRDAAGYNSEPIADALLTRLLGRASIAAEEVEAGRLTGDYGKRPADPLFAAAMEAPIGAGANQPPPSVTEPSRASPSVTVADLERAFRETKFPSVSPSTVQGYAPVFRLLRDVLGADTPLASITHDDGLRLFETVKALPTNALKRGALKELGTVAAVAEGKRLGLAVVSAKTVNDKYMGNIGALFRFAAKRGWISINPVHGLRARDPVNDRDRRDSFGPSLQKLFGATPWTPKDTSKPLHYWGPLLGLFHGLRLGEIAGLLVRDISEEGGEPMLLLRDGKRPLKTKAARRDMPLHPTLIELGFLKFVKEGREKAAGDELLFPGQKAYARDQWGRGLGEWFGKRVKALGLEGTKLGMHSLRHDFRDALREAEVSEEVAHYLMGHTIPGMSKVYGRPRLPQLKAAMAKISYDCLSLGN
jgi:integrase